jgi:hypothetical protein
MEFPTLPAAEMIEGRTHFWLRRGRAVNETQEKRDSSAGSVPRFTVHGEPRTFSVNGMTKV